MELELGLHGMDDDDDGQDDLARLGAFRVDLELQRIRDKEKARKLDEERRWERTTQKAFREKVRITLYVTLYCLERIYLESSRRT
jgi:hypothetical protein